MVGRRARFFSSGPSLPGSGGAMTASLPEIETKIRALAAGIAEAEGLELIDLVLRQQGRKWFLRATIDRDGGVDAEDCARVSRQLGTVLDVEDLIPHRYILEVSSPGVDRPLREPADFRRNVGRLVRLVLREPFEGRTEYRGRIFACGSAGVALRAGTGEGVEVPWTSIAEGKLLIDWRKPSGGE